MTDQIIKRTEEVEHIVDRMPHKYGLKVTIIVLSIIIIIIGLGFLISYPDVQIGTVTINTQTPAIRIISNQSGKIILKRKNQELVKEGDVLAYLDNPANMDDIYRVNEIISDLDITNIEQIIDVQHLPAQVFLGAINTQYYNFLNALQQFQNYYNNNLYQNQLRTYTNLLKEQNNLLDISTKKEELSLNSMDIMERFAERDSILLAKKVISLAEFERNNCNPPHFRTGIGTIIQK